MQVSLKTILVVVIFLSIITALSYAVPFMIGYLLLTVISLVVFPPVLVTGVVYSRGSKQAFFIGCMVTGMIHYFINFYMAVSFLIGGAFTNFDIDEVLVEDTEVGLFVRSFTLMMYALGFLGGCSAWVAHRLFHKQTDAQISAKEPAVSDSELG